ncbi:MAG TPA: hypothetical protein VMM36_12890, partial [Opitutaceae bacterium]|nr:hypothetical protein [Opitutaceae bacterium]
MKTGSPRFREYATRGVRSLVSASAILSLWTVLYLIVIVIAIYQLIPARIGDRALALAPWFLWIGIGLVIWKPAPFKISLPVLVVSGAFLAFLAWDDSEPVPPLRLPPVVSEESEIGVAYSRLMKGHPESRLSEAVQIQFRFNPGSEDWVRQVEERSDEIEAAYANDRLGREWIDAMSATPPDGIFKPGGADRLIPSF